MPPIPGRGDSTTVNAAHDINNPLFAILALTEFLLRDAEPGSKTHQRLLLIQQNGREIKEIVKALAEEETGRWRGSS
jgi:signal transduction histidine kinase